MSHAALSAAQAAFTRGFGEDAPIAAMAPSRVELLGNHTDYNGGLVLAAAIDRFTAVVGRPVAGRSARVLASNFQGQIDAIDLDRVGSEAPRPEGWTRYVRGVLWAVQGAYSPLGAGFEAAIAGDVPLGAGLSSSASLQAALAVFLIEAGLVKGAARSLTDEGRMGLARILKRSENEYVGVGSGLLDQFSVLMGRANHALMLDCRTQDYARLPLGDPAPAIVVCDSRTSRRLADGMYNRRRDECERVVAYFQQGREGVEQLRDLSPGDIAEHWDRLDPVARKRARHVVTENERVRQGAAALKAGDVAAFGRLMSLSHASSRDDFENSSPALDALIEVAEAAPGFLGGKLSGAGWAGCTVNLVEHGRESGFAEAVRVGYARRTGNEPIVHVCRAADGACGATPPGAMPSSA